MNREGWHHLPTGQAEDDLWPEPCKKSKRWSWGLRYWPEYRSLNRDVLAASRAHRTTSDLARAKTKVVQSLLRFQTDVGEWLSPEQNING